MMEDNHHEKLSLLSELILFAKAHQEINASEYEFLKAIANQLGITTEEFETLLEKQAEFTPPQVEFDRILQFHRLCLLMNIDLESSEEEVMKVKDIAIRLGLNPLATNQVLEQMSQYENKMVPPEILIRIFSSHHN